MRSAHLAAALELVQEGLPQPTVADRAPFMDRAEAEVDAMTDDELYRAVQRVTALNHLLRWKAQDRGLLTGKEAKS